MRSLIMSSGAAPLTLGSWPDWVVAVATSLAFLIAAITYMRNSKSSREAQARQVFATVIETSHHERGQRLEERPDVWRINREGVTFYHSTGSEGDYLVAEEPVSRVLVKVHNGSRELIGPVKVMVVNTGTGAPSDRVWVPFGGAIEPLSDELFDIILVNLAWPGQFSLGAAIIFRDSSGRWWRRYRTEPIEAIHDDPNNTAESPVGLEAIALGRRVLGIGDLPPAPRPSAKVRLHRGWRRLRGKTPIP